ncbi:hypothetical protein ABC195_16120 [Microbacterium sp. 2P01SA-2]|uniref:hypothetical protein n=1 Tax=unclassified Microbacterium TaxID=2609290 RepID=UPI0039A00EAC
MGEEDVEYVLPLRWDDETHRADAAELGEYLDGLASVRRTSPRRGRRPGDPYRGARLRRAANSMRTLRKKE